MSEATTNLTTIEADSVKTWDPVVKRYVDLRDSVVGLAPETLDTLEKIAASIGDDPDYAAYVDGELATKRDITDSYSAAQTDAALALKRNVADSYTIAQVDGALALKAPLASPAFTGTVTGITKTMVGLDQVDNTSDANKPVSTAQQAALDTKLSVAAANNTAYAWSSGAVGDGYHYVDSGTDALVLRTNGGVVAANVLGSVAGAQEGEVLFYKNVECLGALTLPGGTNVLTTLQGKQDSLTFQTATEGDSNATLATGTTVKGLSAQAPISITEQPNGLRLEFDSGRYQLAFAAQLPLKQLISFPSGELQLLIDPALDLTMENFTANAALYTDNIQAKTVATAVTIKNQAGTTVATFADNGDVAMTAGAVQLTDIKSTGTPGVEVLTSAGANIAKFWDSGLTTFSGDVPASGQAVSCGSVTTTGNLTVGGTSTLQGALDVTFGGAVFETLDNGDGCILASNTPSKSIGLSSGPSYGTGSNYAWCKLFGGASGSAILRVNTNGVILNKDATAWASYSDLRMKNVIGPCMNGLARLDQIQPVEFSWKADSSNTPHVGVIAQEVQAVLPEAVSEYTDPDTGETRLTVCYTDLIPMMICAIHELKLKVEALEAQQQS